MKKNNEYRSFVKIFWGIIFGISIFLLAYYKHYFLLTLWIIISIYIIQPKINKK